MRIIRKPSGNDVGVEVMSEELELDMEELCSAEEFLDYFQVPYPFSAQISA